MTRKILYPIAGVVLLLMIGRYCQKFSIEKNIYEECVKEMYAEGVQVLNCKMPYGLKDE